MKWIEDFKKEYETQDNLATAWPIYFTVQELVPIGVIAEGYSPCQDGEVREEFSCENCNTCSSNCTYANEGVVPDKCPKDKEVRVGYIWIDREFFLTSKGAKEFQDSNRHNMGETRVYCKHFDRRNFEMTELLETLGFKVRG